ncbi:MAG: hypothetical protein AAGF89_09745, partial [Bacteroidota bacterium]
MNNFLRFSALLICLLLLGCQPTTKDKNEATMTSLDVSIYETSATGKKLQEIIEMEVKEASSTIELKPEERHQTITGIGGSFTEASASL